MLFNLLLILCVAVIFCPFVVCLFGFSFFIFQFSIYLILFQICLFLAYIYDILFISLNILHLVFLSANSRVWRHCGYASAVRCFHWPYFFWCLISLCVWFHFLFTVNSSFPFESFLYLFVGIFWEMGLGLVPPEIIYICFFQHRIT